MIRNSTDVTYLKRFLLKQINSLPNQKAADVNLDGNINSTDLTHTLKQQRSSKEINKGKIFK